MDFASRFAQAVRMLPLTRGKTHLGWQAMRACGRMASLDGALHVSLDDGSLLMLPRSAPMSWAAAFQGGYDAAVQNRLLQTYIKPDSLVLDIGASLGLWAVPLGLRARAVGAVVWAVEPHPNNERWLRDNIAANGLSDVVTVHAYALGSVRGTAIMQIPEQGKGAAAGNAAIELEEHVALSSVEVEMRRLDDLPRPVSVSFIKIDVEGFELEVLRGAERLIQEDRPVIYGEFNRKWLGWRGENLGEFLTELQSIGYSIYAVEGTRSRLWRAVDGHRMRPVTRYQGEEDLLLLPERLST